MFWRGKGGNEGDLYYTTDNHGSLLSVQSPIETKLNWGDSWSDGVLHHSASHSTCPVWGGGTNEHVCMQRWCCGSPNSGMWFNDGDFLPGDEYDAIGWVR